MEDEKKLGVVPDAVLINRETFGEPSRETVMRKNDVSESTIVGERPGYTPSGGSIFQQSSATIMIILLVLTFTLMVFLIKASFDIKQTFEDQLLALLDFERKMENAEFRAQVDVLAAEYRAGLEDGTFDPDTACNIDFFADPNNNLHNSLVVTFTLMDQLVSIFAILGTIAGAIYLLVKTSVTFNLTTEINREDMPITNPNKVARGGQNNILTISGHLETINQRTTRIYLRSETICYMLVNALLDVPLMTFIFTFYIMSSSTRGTTCAACLDNLEICNVSTFSDLSSSLKTAMALVVISLVWNASLLGERWIEFIKFKKEIRGKYFNPRRYVVIGGISFCIYVLTTITPMLFLFFLELGPKYFDLSDGTIRGFEISAYTGAGLWGTVVFFIAFMAGVDPGELLSSPFLCFEICDVTLAEVICCDNPCCCCC